MEIFKPFTLIICLLTKKCPLDPKKRVFLVILIRLSGIRCCVDEFFVSEPTARCHSGHKPGTRVINLALAIAEFKVSIGDREYWWSSPLISKLWRTIMNSEHRLVKFKFVSDDLSRIQLTYWYIQIFCVYNSTVFCMFAKSFHNVKSKINFSQL